MPRLGSTRPQGLAWFTASVMDPKTRPSSASTSQRRSRPARLSGSIGLKPLPNSVLTPGAPNAIGTLRALAGSGPLKPRLSLTFPFSAAPATTMLATSTSRGIRLGLRLFCAASHGFVTPSSPATVAGPFRRRERLGQRGPRPKDTVLPNPGVQWTRCARH